MNVVIQEKEPALYRQQPRLHLFGISTALVTPFNGDGSVALDYAAKHAERVFRHGAAGVTLFGTTGEGASIGQQERLAMLDGIVGKVVPADCVTICVCANDMEQAVAQAEAACQRGVRRLLLTPPCYFKNVPDEGIFRWFKQVVEALRRYDDLQIILYNLPQVTQVELSCSLVRRLKEYFGETIFGVKDSSGSWKSAVNFLQYDDLAILLGDERLLAKASPLGCAGAISGMANLCPGLLKNLVLSGQENETLSQLVTEIIRYPVTPLVKKLVGLYYGENIWENVRAPLMAVHPDDMDAMLRQVKEIAD